MDMMTYPRVDFRLGCGQTVGGEGKLAWNGLVPGWRGIGCGSTGGQWHPGPGSPALVYRETPS